MGLLRLLAVLYPLGVLSWAALFTCYVLHAEDGGPCGRIADRLMDWVDAA
jgi:hypothetical protein